MTVKLMNMRKGFDKHLAYANSRPREGDQPIRPDPLEPGHLAVAMSAQTGSGAIQVARKLAECLQAHTPATEPPWRVFDRTLMVKVLEDHRLPADMARFLPEDAHNAVDDVMHELLGLHPPSWLIVQQSIETMLNLVRSGNVILVGWGATAVTGKLPNVFQVRLVGSLERRAARIEAREHLRLREALASIERSDRARARYVRRYFQRDVADELQYALVINTDRFPEGEPARLICEAILNRRRALATNFGAFAQKKPSYSNTYGSYSQPAEQID